MKTNSIIIDSHQHFWQLDRNDYGWLTPDLTVLYHDFLPDNIKPLLKQCKVTGTIVVQAAPTLSETHYLLALAEQHEFILGVIGWVDMLKPEVTNDLKQLTKHPKFLGIRPMLQDITNTDWILETKLKKCFNALLEFNLTFDALVTPRHLKNIFIIAKQYPSLKIIIDHGAKPMIRQALFSPWAEDIAALAALPNVYCKLSGLWTEGDDKATVLPYFQHLVKVFLPNKLLWGSDYPVLNCVTDYTDWYAYCHRFFVKHAPDALAYVFGLTALEVYNVKIPHLETVSG